MSKFNRVLIFPIVALIVGAAILLFVRSNKQPADNSTQEKETAAVLDYPFEFDNKKLSVSEALEEPYSPANKNQLYKVDPYNQFFPSQILAKEVSKKLNLSQKDENSWSGTDSSVSFIKSENDNYIRLTFSGKGGTEIKEDLLAERAEESLKSLDLWPFTSITFEKKATILEEPNLNGTKAFLTFSEKINSYPVITNSKGSSEIYIEFNEKGQITSVTYFYVPYKTEPSEEMEFKNIEEIKSALQNGKFKTISTTGSFDSIQIVTINTSYYASKTSDYIQPVLVVSGKNGFGEKVEVLVPAFKDSIY